MALRGTTCPTGGDNAENEEKRCEALDNSSCHPLALSGGGVVERTQFCVFGLPSISQTIVTSL